jgi:hypothetical protein
MVVEVTTEGTVANVAVEVMVESMARTEVVVVTSLVVGVSLTVELDASIGRHSPHKNGHTSRARSAIEASSCTQWASCTLNASDGPLHRKPGWQQTARSSCKQLRVVDVVVVVTEVVVDTVLLVFDVVVVDTVLLVFDVCVVSVVVDMVLLVFNVVVVEEIDVVVDVSHNPHATGHNPRRMCPNSFS